MPVVSWDYTLHYIQTYSLQWIENVNMFYQHTLFSYQRHDLQCLTAIAYGIIWCPYDKTGIINSYRFINLSYLLLVYHYSSNSIPFFFIFLRSLNLKNAYSPTASMDCGILGIKSLLNMYKYMVIQLCMFNKS